MAETDPETAAAELELEAIEHDLLVEAIRLRYGYDFRGYSPASRTRRLRHAIAQSGLGSASAVQAAILRDRAIFADLLDALTVRTTEMFRDPEFYVGLRQHVVPHLLTYPAINVWAAGCASGEEVDSLAITLAEEGLWDRCRLYATDVSPAALESARAGVYPADRIPACTRAYQRAGGSGSFADWYTAAYGYVSMAPRIRERVVFFDHNLAGDDSFAEMHLIVCRNVFIYFEPELQCRAVELFERSLVRRGFLALGSRESLRPSGREAFFEAVDADLRIFRRC